MKFTMEYTIGFTLDADETLDLLPIYLRDAQNKLQEQLKGKKIKRGPKVTFAYSDIKYKTTTYVMSAEAA